MPTPLGAAADDRTHPPIRRSYGAESRAERSGADSRGGDGSDVECWSDVGEGDDTIPLDVVRRRVRGALGQVVVGELCSDGSRFVEFPPGAIRQGTVTTPGSS